MFDENIILKIIILYLDFFFFPKFIFREFDEKKNPKKKL